MDIVSIIVGIFIGYIIQPYFNIDKFKEDVKKVVNKDGK